MPTPTSRPGLRSLVIKRALAVAWGLASVAIAPQVQAEFSPPPSPYEPASPYEPLEPDRTDDPSHSRHRDYDWADSDSLNSMVRFQVGPAVLFQPTSPGLFTALDIGKRSIGARVCAAWLRADSERGLAIYGAELWIDFRHRHQLHPIVGAGASWLRGGAVDDDQNAGAGVLRAALEYELPISDADARIGLNLLGMLPAIGSERTRPWATAALTIGAGF